MVNIKLGKEWYDAMKKMKTFNHEEQINKPVMNRLTVMGNKFARMLRKNIKTQKIGGPALSEEWVRKKRRLEYSRPRAKWMGSMLLFNSIQTYSGPNFVFSGFPNIPIGGRGKLTYSDLALTLEYGRWIGGGTRGGKKTVIHIPSRPVVRKTLREFKPIFEADARKINKEIAMKVVGALGAVRGFKK